MIASDLKDAICNQYPEYSQLSTENKAIVDTAWGNITNGMSSYIGQWLGEPGSFVIKLEANETISIGNLVGLDVYGKAIKYTGTSGERLIGCATNACLDGEYVGVAVAGKALLSLEPGEAVGMGFWLIPSTSTSYLVESVSSISARPANCIGYSIISQTSGNLLSIVSFNG